MITSIIPNLDSMSNVKAKVDFYNGSTLVKTCTCGDFLSDFTVTREGDNSKFFGFGICHKLDINLIDINRELAVTKGNTTEIGLGDGTAWDAPYPTFYLTEVNRNEKTNTITCTAYDKLYWASEYVFADLGLTTPYTLRQVAQAIATKLGLTISIPRDISNSFTLSYEEGANLLEEDMSKDLRVVLNWIAEATQTIYFVNNANRLVFKRLDRDGEALQHVTKNDYYELNTKSPITLTGICNATELGDNLEASTGAEGATQYIRNNPFLELRDDVPTILDSAIALMGGTTITQFECEWVGNYLLEIGDKIALTTEDDSEVYAYILSDTVDYAGTYDEVSSWEYTDQNSETFSNPTNIGEKINQTFARVDKVNKQITLLVSEVEGNSEAITNLTLTANDINLKVSEHEEKIEAIEEANTEINNIVERVAQIEIDLDSINLTVSDQTTTLETLTDATDTLSETTQTLSSQVSDLQIEAGIISATVTNLTENSRINTENFEYQLEQLTQEVSTKITAEDLSIAVKNVVDDGVTKVETSTGFTFDSEGLTIEKSGREMKTQITEDGMTVYRDTTAVLTADNTGVDAKNLKASTYLVIGTNSRFENYGTTRTACFWIGD